MSNADAINILKNWDLYSDGWIPTEPEKGVPMCLRSKEAKGMFEEAINVAIASLEKEKA